MLEWDDQASEFQRNWVKQQQELLGDWLGALQNAGAGQPASMWQEAVAVMEQQVNSALNNQKQSLLKLVDNTRQVEGVPEAFSQWVQQLEQGLELWTDVQQRLWQVWFDMLRTTTPAAETPGETLVKNWQEMARQAASIQEQWLSNWTGAVSGEKPSKPAAAKRSSRTAGKGNGNDKQV